MLDARQSPLGFFNLALSYLDAADHLAASHLDPQSGFRLPFEHPLRHLYSHAWELALKACLFQQGWTPSEMRKCFGHHLSAIWDKVDRDAFVELKLTDQTRIVPEVLDQFHPTKQYAYPETGSRREFSIVYVRSASQRFRLPRVVIRRLFRGVDLTELQPAKAR